MKTQQLKYNFSGSVAPRNLVFSINGKETNISVVSTFTKIHDEKANKLEGWSILEKLLETPIVNHENESITFSLIDPETKEISTVKTEKPFCQWNDISVDDAVYSSFVEKIVELSYPTKTEPEIIHEEENHELENKENLEENSEQKESKEFSNENIIQETTEKETEVAIPIATTEAENGTGLVADSSKSEPIQFDESKFDVDSKEFIEKGYKKFKSENGEFILLTDEEDFMLYQLSKKPEYKGYYFKQRTGDSVKFKKFIVNRIGDRIEVESLEMA